MRYMLIISLALTGCNPNDYIWCTIQANKHEKN